MLGDEARFVKRQADWLKEEKNKTEKDSDDYIRSACCCAFISEGGGL
jgi:hypothetical protein